MPTTTIRYDEAVRDQAAPLLEKMGISLNTYLNMALHQLVVQWRVVPGASPRATVRNGHIVVPADWDDDDDE